MNITYHPPTLRRIGRGDDTEKLYQLELARDKALRKAAEELHRVLFVAGIVKDQTSSEYYGHALPESLLSLLEGQDRRAALITALALIEHYANPDQPDAPNRALLAEMIATWQQARGREFAAILPQVPV